jgi:hypothetical protein
LPDGLFLFFTAASAARQLVEQDELAAALEAGAEPVDIGRARDADVLRPDVGEIPCGPAQALSKRERAVHDLEHALVELEGRAVHETSEADVHQGERRDGAVDRELGEQREQLGYDDADRDQHRDHDRRAEEQAVVKRPPPALDQHDVASTRRPVAGLAAVLAHHGHRRRTLGIDLEANGAAPRARPRGPGSIRAPRGPLGREGRAAALARARNQPRIAHRDPRIAARHHVP